MCVFLRDNWYQVYDRHLSINTCVPTLYNVLVVQSIRQAIKELLLVGREKHRGKKFGCVLVERPL